MFASVRNRPVGQSWQAAFDVEPEGWYFPAAQTRHAEAVSTNSRPAGQNAHEGMGAVFCDWYVPAGQAVQATLSVRTPTKQLRGVLPLAASNPSLQAGAQVAPERSVAGQLPALPLAGGRLALSQGIV